MVLLYQLMLEWNGPVPGTQIWKGLFQPGWMKHRVSESAFLFAQHHARRATNCQLWIYKCSSHEDSHVLGSIIDRASLVSHDVNEGHEG